MSSRFLKNKEKEEKKKCYDCTKVKNFDGEEKKKKEKLSTRLFPMNNDTIDLNVVLVYYGTSVRTFVSRCRKGRNDRISVPSSCFTHCSLIKTVTLYLLAACLARALHEHTYF